MTRATLPLAAAFVLAARPAFGAVSVDTVVDPPEVEVGDTFRVQVTAMGSDGEQPSDPDLRLPAGVHGRGPSVGTQTQVTISMGRMVRRTGLTATWTLSATKPGTYELGPPSVDVDGKRARGRSVTVRVLPAGSMPRRGRSPFDPFGLFDPFGRTPPGFPFDDEPEEAPEEPPSFPPELAVEHAVDKKAFVRALSTPRSVVVGQLVDVSIYAYGSRGPFQANDLGEPSREGFLAFEADDTDRPPIYQVPIEGRVWFVQRALRLSLFPVRAGNLRIGPARVGFGSRNYRSNSPTGILERESAPLEIVVTEPPLAGRPPGYRLGDVGRYTLTADVQPRSIEQGEAVSVAAKLEGVGNVPESLILPQQKGVEWMTPATSNHVAATDGAVRGYRTFSYVVRLEQAGRVKLGELTLPFYDPESGRYQVARVDLGVIEVKANPAAAASAAPAASVERIDRLAGVLAPRGSLGTAAEPATYLADRQGFWRLLAAGPLSVLALFGTLRAGSFVLTRLRSRQTTLAERARSELKAARRAAGEGGVQAAAAALDRAVHLALEHATGLKSRGVLQSALAGALVERGLAAEPAARAVELLATIENVRFASDGGAEVDRLSHDTERLLAELKAAPRGSKAS